MKKVPTSKDLTEVLVHLEPIRQQTKREEEDSKAKEEHPDHHTRREPDFACERRDEIMLGKTKKIEKRRYSESTLLDRKDGEGH